MQQCVWRTERDVDRARVADDAQVDGGPVAVDALESHHAYCDGVEGASAAC